MKKFRYSVLGKSIAIFLLIICMLGTVGCTMLFIANVETNLYENSEEFLWRHARERQMVSDCYEITSAYNVYYNDWWSEGVPLSEPESTNFRFNLYDADGELLVGTYQDEPYQDFTSFQQVVCYDQWSEEDQEYVYREDKVQIEGYVIDPLTVTDTYSAYKYWIHIWYQTRYAVPVLALVFLACTMALFVSLMCAAGRRPGQEEVIKNRTIDRVPFDLLLAVYVIGSIACIALFEESYYYGPVGVVAVIWVILALILGGLLITSAAMSLAVRVKLGCLIREMVIYRIARWCWRVLKALKKGIVGLFRGIPLIWQVAVVVLAISIVEFLLLAQGVWSDDLMGFWFVEKLILVPFILYITLVLRRLEKGGAQIAAGQTDMTINTRYLFGPFLKHAENLNRIGDGINAAVNARLKSERFKTELITNVSHDIKTPLTSIINYVDLIKKEDPGTEPIHEYIGVLDRQSIRLKKLIEDLVEASKASTGNLQVTMAPCQADVLLGQAVAEYEEKLSAKSLDLQLKAPEEPVTIMADGRHLWRVFDNLLNNICKYSLEGTRVYLNLERKGNQAVITFRNISRYSLNITSEELMERFVRGDSSRNTEGSGLGLSIARSLVELQNGTIDLVVDGDLFKVILVFQVVDAV